MLTTKPKVNSIHAHVMKYFNLTAIVTKNNRTNTEVHYIGNTAKHSVAFTISNICFGSGVGNLTVSYAEINGASISGVRLFDDFVSLVKSV